MKLMPALATTERGLMRLLMDPIKLGLIGGAPHARPLTFTVSVVVSRSKVAKACFVGLGFRGSEFRVCC